MSDSSNSILEGGEDEICGLGIGRLDHLDVILDLRIYNYRSIPGKRPLPGKRPPPIFGLVSVSAHVPGKRPPPFFSIQAKRPPPLTRPPTVSVSRSACNSQATKHGQNNVGHVQNKKGSTTAHS